MRGALRRKMSHKPLKLKVCGMRDPANVASVGALAPDFLGFIFVPESPRFAGRTVTREVVGSLPQGVQAIGVFRDEPMESVARRAQSLGLSGVQLHGQEDRSYMEALREELPKALIIKAVGVSGASDIERLSELEGAADLVILDHGRGGSGVPFDWKLLQRYRAATPFLLAGGVGAENIGEALEVAQGVSQCAGFDINSKVEVEPGVKDISKVREFKKRMSG